VTTTPNEVWILSDSDDNWGDLEEYPTREAAIAEAQEFGEGVGAGRVWVGRAKELRVEDVLDFGHLVDVMNERAYDRTGLEDSFIDFEPARKAEIEKAVADVLREHCDIAGHYQVLDIAEVEGYRPPEDLDV
jgi:hypothetical protein